MNIIEGKVQNVIPAAAVLFFIMTIAGKQQKYINQANVTK